MIYDYGTYRIGNAVVVNLVLWFSIFVRSMRKALELIRSMVRVFGKETRFFFT